MEKWQRSIAGTYGSGKKLQFLYCPCKLNSYQSEYNEQYKQYRTCSTHGEILNAHRILIGKSETNLHRNLGLRIPVTDFNTKIDKEIGCVVCAKLNRFMVRSTLWLFERYFKFSGSVRREEILEKTEQLVACVCYMGESQRLSII